MCCGSQGKCLERSHLKQPGAAVSVLIRIFFLPLEGTRISLRYYHGISTIVQAQGALLEILGGSVPPASLNPVPILDQKLAFSTPVFRPYL